ncbi:hypothetical protein FPV67DRAFT_1668867 [Lyophyllum atratum]|nr:hypothetical protein FPV67DRAFT_1668867 [Lyophyllum atratum]
MPPKTHNLYVKGTVDSGIGRKVAKKSTIPTTSLDQALAAALSGGPPSIARQLPKRKTGAVELDSEVEILDGPANPSPSKKQRKVSGRARTSSTMPQPAGPKMSTFLEKLDASLAASEAADQPAEPSIASSAAAGHAFNTPVASVDSHASGPALDDDETLEAAPVIVSQSGRPVAKSKTEKARLAEVEAAAAILNKRKTVVRVNTVSAERRVPKAARPVSPETPPKVVDESPALELADPEHSDDASDDSDRPPVLALFQASLKGHRLKAPQLPSDDEKDEALSSPPGTPAGSANPFVDVEARESRMSAEPSEDEGASGNDSDGSDARSVASVEGYAVVGADDIEKGHDSDAVMDPALWHPMMAAGYEALPHIKTFMDVAPYTNGSSQTDLSSMRFQVKEMMAYIPQAIPSLAAGLTFVRYGNFVNMARISPSALVYESNRIKMADTRQAAVGIMLGVVTDCSLFTAATTGSISSQIEVHRITIAPAPQEMRRDTSIWGALLDFPDGVITGPSSPLGFSFTTFPKGKGGSGSFSAPTSPRKTFKFGHTVASPKVMHTGASFGNPVRFEDVVPVFDGRGKNGVKAFMFTPEDFKSLSGSPGRRRYHNNIDEVPDESVVAVGYTVGTYFTRAKYLSSNVLFVIVLGTPSDVPKEVDQGNLKKGTRGK